jgi:hypothetical protein
VRQLLGTSIIFIGMLLGASAFAGETYESDYGVVTKANLGHALQVYFYPNTLVVTDFSWHFSSDIYDQDVTFMINSKASFRCDLSESIYYLSLRNCVSLTPETDIKLERDFMLADWQDLGIEVLYNK